MKKEINLCLKFQNKKIALMTFFKRQDSLNSISKKKKKSHPLPCSSADIMLQYNLNAILYMLLWYI